jgi:2-keto-4-pentenoate hydratase/2-oxohepta-3-ene-1,7-dioic acid hydratase in catechol pathway
MLRRFMRIIRFIDDAGAERWGVPNGDGTAEIVLDQHGLLTSRPTVHNGLSVRELLHGGEAFPRTGISARITTTLAPAVPINILCAGRNFQADDSGSRASADHLPPLELFMKPTTAMQHPGQPIVLPASDGTEPDVDAEGELAVLIGAVLRNATARDALNAIVGCTVAIDVTDRRWQTPTGPPLWMRGKGFDTFCPVGPALVTADELDNELAGKHALPVQTLINGETVRDGDTSQMIRSVMELIVEISRFITVLPGTLLLTGAPAIGPAIGSRLQGLKDGDVIIATVGGVGRLTCPIRACC